MEHITEKTVGNYRIRTFYDESPESPRNWDNLGTMVCFHRNYDLGDKHDYTFNDYDSWDEMEKDIIKRENVGVILPLYLYDHSGVTMNTTGFECRWDSGQVGFIFISKEKIREEYKIKRITKEWVEKITEYLKSEVETYDQFLRGDVFGYRMYKVSICSLGHEHEEEIDSCWEFYSEEECFNEAEGIVNYRIKNEVVTDENFSDMLHSVDKN